MRREPSNIFINIGLYLLLFFISSTLLAQTAEVVSGDTAICVSGEISFKVKFSGGAPFGIVYKVINVEDNTYVTYPRLHQSDAIKTEDMDADNVWTETLTLSKSSKITVLKVYDATIEQKDNSTPGDPAWFYDDGVDVIDQEMNIRVDHMPNPDAGSDINALCGYIATLSATPGDAAQPHYWSPSPDGTFLDPSDPATTFEATDLGTFTLWFVEESGVCIDSSSVSVDLLGSPKATLSGSETICSTDGTSTSPQITLTVNYESNSAPYSYTVSDGTVSRDRNGIITTPDVFSMSATGDQVFKITSLSDTRGEGKQCYAVEVDDMGSAIVTDLKPAAYAGEDKIVCGELTTTLEGELEYPVNSGKWLATGISFGNDTIPNTTASSATYGIYPITWTETEPVLGCTNSNDVVINFADLPDLTYSKDTAICQGGTAILHINATGNSPWVLTYNVDGTNSTDITLNAPVEYESFTPEKSIVVIMDSIVGVYGCVTQLKKSYVVAVDEMPVANAGSYDPVCSDQIQLNAVPSISNTSGYWQGNGVFDDLNNSSTLFTSDSYGAQSLTWTETNSKNAFCTSLDKVSIRFDQKPQEPYAGDDKKLYIEFSTILEADATDAGTGTWTADSPDITFNDINNPSSTVDNLNMGVQTLTWTVSNGVCENQADDVVIEVKGLTNPTGFSPNGDGVNDFFKIMGGQQIAGNELTVFDRKGKVVFLQKNYNNDWEGTGLDGSPLDDGTYYYIFTGDNIDPIKEYLIIKRSKTE